VSAQLMASCPIVRITIMKATCAYVPTVQRKFTYQALLEVGITEELMFKDLGSFPRDHESLLINCYLTSENALEYRIC